MSRLVRIAFPGAWYHITNSGTQSKPIFYMDQHRKMFLEILEDVVEKHGVEIHTYCLMNSEYHLIVRTPKANISRAIHHLDTVYATRFNKILNRQGPVFKGRFRSVLLQEDPYVLELSRYLHRKPLKAKMVTKPEYYQWSSLQAYLGRVECPHWLRLDVVYHLLAQRESPDSNILKFVPNKPAQQRIGQHKKPFQILGNDDFTSRVEIDAQERGFIDEFRRQSSYKNHFSMQKILDVIMKMSGQTRAKIFTSTRGRRNDERLIFMYIAREKCGYKLSEIKNFMGLKCKTTITMGVKRMVSFIEDDSILKSLLEMCLAELQSMDAEN